MRIIVFTDIHRGFSSKTSLVHDKALASIDKTGIDAVVICGDWGTTKFDHVKGAFKAFRTAFGTIPILGVKGNHDYWDKEHNLASLEKKIDEAAKRFNIQLLEKNPFIFQDVIIFGFNGWYKYGDPNEQNIKDNNLPEVMYRHWGGVSANEMLHLKEKEAVDFILNYPKDNKKVVTVSHFPFVKESITDENWCGNEKYGEMLLPLSKYILFGHTHEKFDQVIKGCRVINVGSGYTRNIHKNIEENLAYLILDI